MSGVPDVLGPLASAALAREQPLPAQRVTADAGTPLATLMRLFGLGDPVDAAEVEAGAARPCGCRAPALGLVAEEGAGVVATCDLRPYAEEEHAAGGSPPTSPRSRPGAPVREDHVLGIGGASTTLAAWTIAPPGGAGARPRHRLRRPGPAPRSHADAIVVTDLSERALAFARFNAALNGCDWDVAPGSMLDPVAGERFELVVSNPPFVITPRSRRRAAVRVPRRWCRGRRDRRRPRPLGR